MNSQLDEIVKTLDTALSQLEKLPTQSHALVTSGHVAELVRAARREAIALRDRKAA